MKRVTRAIGGVLAAGALAVGAWDAWGRFRRGNAEPVPYTVLDSDGPFEVREYPDVVVARTVADDQRDAFRRLFEYTDGANHDATDVAMTAPVATTPSETVPSTTPVATTTVQEGVEMSFFLPAEYTLATAPEPTDDRVELALVEHRRVAVVSFSWFATEAAIDRARRRLDRERLVRGLDAADDPELLRYDDPRTPPWQRRNELLVELA